MLLVIGDPVVVGGAKAANCRGRAGENILFLHPLLWSTGKKTAGKRVKRGKENRISTFQWNSYSEEYFLSAPIEVPPVRRNNGTKMREGMRLQSY